MSDRRKLVIARMTGEETDAELDQLAADMAHALNEDIDADGGADVPTGSDSPSRGELS